MGVLSFLQNRREVVYDPNTETYTCYGKYPDDVFHRLLGSKIKNMIFAKVSLREFTFHRIFIYEVVELLKECMSRTRYGGYATNIKFFLEEIERIEADLNKSNYYKEVDFSIIDKETRYKPFDYQAEFFRYYSKYKKETGYRGVLLDAAIGAGKSYMALSVAIGIESEYVIIVCPLPTLEKVWINSLTKDVFKKPQKYWTTKSNSPYNGEKFIVAHFEAIDKLYDILKQISLSRVTIIVDEVHSFAAEKSKRTILLNDILDLSKSKDIILMSGTPIKSYSVEIMNLLRMLDDRMTKKQYETFRYIYGNPNAFFKSILPNKYKLISYKIEKKESKLEPYDITYIPIKLKNSDKYTLPVIKEEMKKYIERRKEEIDRMMPTIIETYETCLKLALDAGFPQKDMNRYRMVVKEIQVAYKNKTLGFIPQTLLEANKLENQIAQFLPVEYKKQFIDFKTIIKYPMLKIQGECLGRVILRARIDCHIDIAANLEYDAFIEATVKDTIIFSNYVEVCEAARLKTMNMGYQPVPIYGADVKNLNSNIKLFVDNKKANPLITTYKALSTGVPLTNANVVIALDLPFRMYIFEQAIGRAWRVGQDSKVTVFIPSLDTGDVPNINQRNFDIITFFNTVVEELTGYKSSVDIKETKDLDSLSTEAVNNKIMGLDMDSIFQMFKYDMNLKDTVTDSLKLKYLEW